MSWMAGPAAVPGVDPSRVSTPDELAACLNGLRRRRGLSYEAMEAAAKLPSRSGRSRREPLPKSTVGEIVTGRRLPTKGKLLTFLDVCEVAPADLAQWLAAWERASTADLARPGGGVRVRDARPHLLGVHEAIKVSGVPDDVPPEYVPRDVDAAEFGVRTKVTAGAERGGFVLLVGGSSVGKTRCALEAVKTLLPEWWLVHPAGPAEVTALAQAPPPRTVVWLDELQRYLDGEHGLTGSVVRALLTASHPVVIIGTLWPDLYKAYTAVRVPGAADPHAREREVLDLAAVVRIDPEFSPAEQDRARAAAARDRRLTVALQAPGYGLTQTLAAAPHLVARWQDAKTDDPYAWAVLTAALDVARLGARAPLGPDLLRDAAPDYCTSQQLAEAPDNWFEQALAYATEKLHGAVAALTPAGAGMGQLTGYTVADYLIQHATRERRSACVPASTWDAVLNYIYEPGDAARLADSAWSRLLYGYANQLYIRAASAGDSNAAWQLTNLLAERGDRDRAAQILRPWADVNGLAAWKLAELLAEGGDLDELRARGEAGDGYAAARLAELLADQGELDEAVQVLRVPADTPRGVQAAGLLADLLVRRGDLDGLRTRADAGDRHAALGVAELLAKRGDLDQAENILRARAAAGDWDAARQLGELLATRGDLDGAAQLFHAQADVGDEGAAWLLADLLAERGDLEGLRARAEAERLRARADADDGFAAERLADLLAERGDLEGLRARADADDRFAAERLADLLAKRGNPDRAAQILRAQVDAGDKDAARSLAGLLTSQGQGEEAEQLLRFGLNPDGSIAF